MGRNNADFNGVTFRYEKDSEGDHNVIAEHPAENEPIGYLTWANRDYEEGAQRGHIMDVHVAPEYQRKGIATGMFNHAMSIASSVGAPHPIHAESRTVSGEAWAKKVGEYYPPEEIVKY
jgi:GNAT superfamily N-acetyltransferase